MSLATGNHQTVMNRLAELVDELLDAHCDTLCLVDGLSDDPEWAAHADYLRDLQRVGQETLAELAVLA